MEELLDIILNGNCTLFLGAGASVGALNIKKEKFKTTKQLTELLYNECGIASDNDISNAVDEFIEIKGEHSLINLLKEEFTVSEITDSHKILANIEWNRIYTTNYDNILEFSFNTNKKILTPITLVNKPYHYKDKKNVCIHINGFINSLTPETLYSEFKLTQVSYLSEDFKNCDWGSLFRQDINTSDAIIFIGFSLNYDLDLRRIIAANTETKKKCYFVLHENESEANIRNISKYGTPLLIGFENFAQQLSERKKQFIPKLRALRKNYLCFRTPKATNIFPDKKDKDVFELFVKGNINHNLLRFSILNEDNYEYFLYRDKLKSVINLISHSNKNIAVLSDLGNGKTMFVEGLSFLLQNTGYNVFIHHKNYATINREIEEICSSEKNAVIIIENYGSYLDILESIKNLRSDLILIVTERSLVHDIISHKLETIFNNHDYNVIDLNVLSDDEINKLIKLFDVSGLWGDFSSKSYFDKFELINYKCKKSLRIFLLNLLKSPIIISKFSNSIETIKNKKNYYEAIILILVSKIFGFSMDLEELTYILDDELLNKNSFQKDAAVNELINFNKGQISVHSSILSEVILSHIFQSDGIIETLIKVCKRLDNRRQDKNTKLILRSLISFSNLQRILKKDTEEYKYYILRFFEEVKNLNYCKTNPLFWLQYAIARLSERDYEQADIYFKNAYAFADKLEHFDSYQIDNHHARHLIENEIYNGSIESCMPQFIKAHNVIMNPFDKNVNRHYPFRVASNYFPFYNKYFNNLKKQDKKIFLHCCDEVCKKIDVYLENVENYRVKNEVKKTREMLKIIMENNLPKK